MPAPGQASNGEHDILCVIGPRAVDRAIVEAAGLRYARLRVGGIHGMAPWHAVANVARFALAVPRAAAIVRRYAPRVVLVGGGYVSAPVALAAWALRVPLVTLCVDVTPGWAVRFAAQLSTVVAVAFPEARERLPRARLTGYPVRREFLAATRDAARRRMTIPLDDKVVLAFGGSLGARDINVAVQGALDRLLHVAHVIHVTGQSAAGPRSPRSARYRYLPFAFLDAAAMADALAAADLVICRAGASTLAELPVSSTPAILVPGEFSLQERNARFMADRGAAIVIANRDLTADRLAVEATALLADEARLATMAIASRALAERDAAQRVAALIEGITADG